MDTKIKLEFESAGDCVVYVNGQLVTNVFESTVSMPCIVTVDVQKVEHYVKLTKAWLGGIPLPEFILNQICISDNGVHNCWTLPTKSNIELFAKDFVQYHLMYQNKFTKSFS